MESGMKEIKYLNDKEIEVDGKIYTIMKDEDIKEYAGFYWHVLRKENDGTVVSLVGKLPKNIMQQCFNKNVLDDDGDIKFNNKCNNIWWRDSNIRMGLNSKFLELLNLDDLVEMETTLNYDNQCITTRDYVRVPTKEEYENMSEKFRKLENSGGTIFRWSLSPAYCSGGAGVFYVNNGGDLRITFVTFAGGVVPVIKLKTEVLEKSN